jgi:putative nucleotidyltransferase with HDIG domain
VKSRSGKAGGKLELDLARRVYELETIRDIGLQINTLDDVHAVVDMILRSVMGTLGATSGAASLYREREGELAVEASSGCPRLANTFAVPRSAARWMTARNRPFLPSRVQARDAAAFFRETDADHGGLPVHAWLPLVNKGKLLGVISLGGRLGSREYDAGDLHFLTAICGQAAQALSNAEAYQDVLEARRELDRANGILRKISEGVILAMVQAVEMRDPYTAGHQKRVANLAVAIARRMGLDGKQVDGIRMAGMIHDLGKIAVPAEILSKPGRITEIEYSFLKTHPQVGSEILKGIELPWPVATIILQHHEDFNGAGYPSRLQGADTLIEARIIRVADSLEATAAHRPYRPGKGIKKALEEMHRDRGTRLDPRVVDSCHLIFRKPGISLESFD